MKKLVKYNDEFLIVQDLYRNVGEELCQYLDNSIYVNTAKDVSNLLNVITHSTMDVLGAIKIDKDSVIDALGGRDDNHEYEVYFVFGKLLILQ